MFTNIIKFTFIFFTFCCCSISKAVDVLSIPILTYHNFDTTPARLSVTPEKFEQQVRWLKNNGYSIIPLMNLVNYFQGKTSSLPPKSVIITVDDGKKSVYSVLPIIRKYQIPVTLFVYPSSISNASYALTWEQLKELHNTGLVDIQSHTYWHPDFTREKKKLSIMEYKKFVAIQLSNSKKRLEEKLNFKVTLLAWPYGIYDNYLKKAAAEAGYTMAFSIDDRKACKKENIMAQPRYLVSGKLSMQTFAKLVKGD